MKSGKGIILRTKEEIDAESWEKAIYTSPFVETLKDKTFWIVISIVMAAYIVVIIMFPPHQKICVPKKTVLSQESQARVISEYSILRPFILSLENKTGGNKKWNAN